MSKFSRFCKKNVFPLLRMRKSTIILFIVAFALHLGALNFYIEMSLLTTNLAKIPLLLAAIDVFDNAVFGTHTDIIDEIRQGNLALAIVYASLYIMGGLIMGPI